METYELNVLIRSDGEASEVRLVAPVDGPLANALKNELQSVVEEMCHRVRMGQYLGGYVREGDDWVRDEQWDRALEPGSELPI